MEFVSGQARTPILRTMSQPLVIDDDDRYSRLRLISWWDQDKLKAAKVLVVGAGALGNEVLKNLALLGIGRIIAIDFDHIENSNLTRSVLFRARDRGRPKAEAAAEALRDINPDCHITPLHANVITDVGLGLFRNVDVVIGCLDNREARLWVNRQCWKVGTPWIDGGIQEISGVVKVFTPPDSACYECAMTENDYRLINLRYSCPLLSQDDLSRGRVPTAPTISSMIAALQTQEALKLLHGMAVSAGQALVFSGVTNQFYATQLPFKEDCLSHDMLPEPIEIPLKAAETTANQLFAAARPHFSGEGKLRLELDRDLVASLTCHACGRTRKIMRPQQLVKHREAACECGQTAVPLLVNAVDAAEEFAAEKLSSLGIPPYDIVRVSCGEEERAFLLAGDGGE
jgi:molybdopterin/thiamine biosynthesis adenylyltransferase